MAKLAIPEAHPIAAFYPMMDDEHLNKLAADIKENGQQFPIVMFKGQILDGRNRYEACARAGVEPITEPWDEKGDLEIFVRSRNDHRRHYTAGQRAAVAAKWTKYYAEQAKARKKEVGAEAGKKGGRGNKRVGNETTPTLSGKGKRQRNEEGRSAAKAAKREGASVGATKIMTAIEEHHPDIAKLVLDGKINVSQAQRLVATHERDRPALLMRLMSGEKAKDVVPPKEKTTPPKRPAIDPESEIAKSIADKPTTPPAIDVSEANRHLAEEGEDFNLASQRDRAYARFVTMFHEWPKQYHSYLIEAFDKAKEEIRQ